MFFSADGPADPHCDELVTLHRSMNAPVVAIEDIPVGPAHAAVALSRGGDGAVNVTIAVRCARTGRVAYFTAGGELRELRSTDIVMDAALSFAESMGFLFDDEEVEIRGAVGPREAAKIWQRFLHADSGETAPADDLETADTDLESSRGHEPEAFAARGSIPPRKDPGGASGRAGASAVADELGPILSPVAPNLSPTGSGEFSDGAPEYLTLDAGLDDRLDTGPPLETDEVPFWLAIPREDVPRQSARAPAPVPDAAGHDRIEVLARPEGESSAGVDSAPENRELLRTVVAETTVDRVCAPSPTPGPGLSKFRLKPSDSGVKDDSLLEPDSRGDPLSQPARRSAAVSDAAETPGLRASQSNTNPSRVAQYHESVQRPHLLLRLLSRF